MLQRRTECHKQRGQRRLQLERSSCRQVNYLPGLLIVLLVLLQNFELHMCRQLMNAGALHKRSHAALSKDTEQDIENQQLLSPALGRDETQAAVSQPEEVFRAPNEAPDMGYDEYPMVVPKRAALLLDRLMVALHHALENEREGHRISDFYANKNLAQQKAGDYRNGLEQLQATENGNVATNSHSFHMYSDDDPGVLMDYDFKDLNQINRATGETLMAKSFQRRAGGIGVPDVATLTPGSATAAGAGAGPGTRRAHHMSNGGGRMYWRCYFNAVSCF